MSRYILSVIVVRLRMRIRGCEGEGVGAGAGVGVAYVGADAWAGFEDANGEAGWVVKGGREMVDL